MRRSILGVSIVGAVMLLASLAYGVGVVEDFEGYTNPPGYTTDWYWFVNDAFPPVSSWVADADFGAGVDMAAWFQFGSWNLNKTIDNTIRFQTDVWVNPVINDAGVLDPALVASSFSGLADVVGETALETVVSSARFYIGIDTSLIPDGVEDVLYVSPALSRGGNPSGWEFEDSYSLLDGTTSWQVWTWNGSRFAWDGITTQSVIPTTTTDDMLVAGLQFDVPKNFASTGATYFDIWVDNVVVPEPGALLLACFGAVGILLRRSRRQAA
jgi:hypothetical protein